VRHVVPAVAAVAAVVGCVIFGRRGGCGGEDGDDEGEGRVDRKGSEHAPIVPRSVRLRTGASSLIVRA
jgi:hypothetical protein